MVERELHFTDQVLTVPGPILKGFFDEIADGEDQPSFVPNPHHGISQSDLLHRAPFSFYYDGVVDPHGLSEGDLETENEVPQGFLGGQTDHDTEDGRGSKERGPHFLHFLETQQDRSEDQNADQNGAGSFEELDLGPDLPLLKVFVASDLVRLEENVLEDVEGFEEDPSEIEDQKHQHEFFQHVFRAFIQSEIRKADVEEEQREEGLHSPSEMLFDGIPDVKGSASESTEGGPKPELHEEDSDEPGKDARDEYPHRFGEGEELLLEVLQHGLFVDKSYGIHRSSSSFASSGISTFKNFSAF